LQWLVLLEISLLLDDFDFVFRQGLDDLDELSDLHMETTRI
jgi:hypothetical protein